VLLIQPIQSFVFSFLFSFAIFCYPDMVWTWLSLPLLPPLHVMESHWIVPSILLRMMWLAVCVTTLPFTTSRKQRQTTSLPFLVCWFHTHTPSHTASLVFTVRFNNVLTVSLKQNGAWEETYHLLLTDATVWLTPVYTVLAQLHGVTIATIMFFL